MQEIVLLLSSLAGVATAAAVRKIPRDKKQLLSLGASSQIKSQISSLNIERNILTKTISRLYQADSEFSKIQKDKLLLKYQHQLGVILARLEKLQQASDHPDLGPVGDGLITLMDKKLSKFDDALYELSSKITTLQVEEPKSNPEIKNPEIKDLETKEAEVKEPANTKPKERPIQIPAGRPGKGIELTTLTDITKKDSPFPLFDTKPIVNKPQTNPLEPIAAQNDILVGSEQTRLPETFPKPDPIEPKLEPITPQTDLPKSDLPQQKIIPETTPAKLDPIGPQPKTTPESITKDTDIDGDDDDDDGADLARVKDNIARALAKLDQAEVE